jgi:integrase
MTVAEWVVRWTGSYEGVWSPNTTTNYHRYLKPYILRTLGHHRLSGLTPIVVREFVASIPAEYADANARTRRFGPTSRYHVFHVITSFMHDAAANSDVSGLRHNPIEGMRAPSLPSGKAPEAPWTPAEIEQFFRSCKGDYLAVPFALAGFGALRESEILGLIWADVDFEAGLIYVRRQLDRGGTLRSRLKSKREDEARVVAPPAAVMKLLAAYKARKRAQQVAAGSRWEGLEDLVVTTYLGKPYGHRNFLRELDRLAKRHGIRHSSVHGLRRAADSLMKMRGVPGATRQHLMGHASLRTTERYDYLYDETIRGAATALGDAFPLLNELADAS